MILIVNLCKEKLHSFEFVKPIEDILTKNKVRFLSRHYKNLDKEDILLSKKVIICGTSLKDDDFLKEINKFKWINNYNKPILGICGGMQVIGLLFNGKLKKKTEIGFYDEIFNNFLGLNGKQKVYHLHNNYVTFSKEFNILAGKKIPQAIKHREKNIFGVLFHPEVRQKEIILNFVK